MDSRLLSGIGAGPDSGSYTDLNRLNQLKVGKDRDGEANIRKVAQEFESLFLNEMLKSMRSANEALGDGNFMNSQTTKQYQDMYDQQLSVSLSKNAGGIGLADVLVRQLSKMKQGSRGNGENPFARVAENGAGRWPSNPSAQAGKALPMPEAGRDDSKLLNQRRLALPGKLAERMLAGIVPSASPAASQMQSLGQDSYLPAQSYPAASRRGFSTDGVDSQGSRRIAQPPLARGKSMFASADEFIATMLPMAQKAAERIGVDARYLVAQAALETGWANRSSASRMAAAATTCSASRPAAAGMVPRRALSPPNTKAARRSRKSRRSAPTRRSSRASTTTSASSRATTATRTPWTAPPTPSASCRNCSAPATPPIRSTPARWRRSPDRCRPTRPSPPPARRLWVEQGGTDPCPTYSR